MAATIDLQHEEKPMKSILIAGACALMFCGTALAAGTHAGGHHGEMPVGQPGKKKDVTRTIKVIMKETQDGKMLFEPAEITVGQGETIRFAVSNMGETDHEFVLDDPAGMAKHKELMAKFPEMEHDDPNAVRLAPGKKGEVIWKFTNAGGFEFGCLIPGHMEAGMHGPLTVAEE
jgi:uncharacterized cupredoxin-like copper-binding protein